MTITAESFNRPATWADVFFVARESEVAIPEGGENQVWDYSNVQYTDDRVRNYEAADNAEYPTATSFYSTPNTFQSFTYPSGLYEVKDEQRWGELGTFFETQNFGITPLTGGPTDTLTFPGRAARVGESGTRRLIFPTTFGSSWVDEFTGSEQFELSVAGFGLNGTPGERRGVNRAEREVIGYGQLILRGDMGNAPNVEYEVLLVRSIETSTDSIFLGGAPAPAPLLAAFQLTQGAMAADTIYEFYGLTDIGAPLFRYNTSTAGDATIFRPQRQGITSVSNPALLRSAVYPNPAPAGSRLSFAFSEAIPARSTFVLRSLDGRPVHRQSIGAATDIISIIPSPLVRPGVYIYSFLSAEGRLLGSGKVLME
ncbi:hypothetical protein A3850_016665 [Lewinella sp. 4G2]|nr:hypothetical protein A3850_016665 [Lewinella sp. 4G2]